VQIYLRGTHGHNKEKDMIGTSRHDTEIDMIGTSRHETEIDASNVTCRERSCTSKFD
jgi:hypothetical protein